MNWDASGTASLDFTLKLSETEKHAWSQAVKQLRDEITEIDAAAAESSAAKEGEPEPQPVIPPVKAPKAAKVAPPPAPPEDEDAMRARQIRAFLDVASSDSPSDDLVVLSRRGAETELSFSGISFSDLPDEIQDILTNGIPRVELIKSLTGGLQDSVAAEELATEEFEFMQGLFFYAGLDPREATQIFEQNDETERQIQAQTTGRWFQEVAKKLIGDEASKVALARNYILACREIEDSVLKQADFIPVKKLCQQIAGGLQLPKLATEGASSVVGS